MPFFQYEITVVVFEHKTRVVLLDHVNVQMIDDLFAERDVAMEDTRELL